MADILKRVEELLKHPENACRQCGMCCNCVIFTGALSTGEILELINNPETPEVKSKGAKDFLSIFEQYPDNREVEAKFPNEYRSIVDKNGENVAIFRCKYHKGRCTNYENRPELCRVYPVLHKDTKYFPGCGYNEWGARNWAEVEKILIELQNKEA